RDKCLLMVRHDGQDIEANALSKLRFIQKPIALHFRERFGDALHGNGFQFEAHKDLLCFPRNESSKQFPQWIEEAIDNSFLERNDGVIGDRDAFRTNLSTTLCDTAQSNPELRFQILQSIAHVQRVHFQGRDMNEESWTNELFLHVMLT